MEGDGVLGGWRPRPDVAPPSPDVAPPSPDVPPPSPDVASSLSRRGFPPRSNVDSRGPDVAVPLVQTKLVLRQT